MNEGVRLLVCGSRHWTNAARVDREIHLVSPEVVIHGGARGADALARTSAICLGIRLEVFHAEWERWGRGAGPRRNERMLREGRPTLGLAFGQLWRVSPITDKLHRTGTGDMVKRMIGAVVPVLWIAEPESPAVALAAMPEPHPSQMAAAR